MSARLPSNRRRGPAATGVVKAPAEPTSAPSDDESPAPAPTARTVRPPPGPPSSRPRSRSFATLQLVSGVLIVLAASVGVAWGARRYLVTSPRFAVRTVEVDGMRRRSPAEVAKAAGVEVGKNVFALDLDAARAAVLTDPWIETATVTRQLPSTVRIAVVEREARAWVVIGGEAYLATRDGDLFKKAETVDPVDLPVVTGPTPDQVAADRPGVVLSVKRALDVADDLDKAGIAKRWPVEELALVRDGSLVVTLGREAIALHLGRPPYRDKIEQVRAVLTELGRRHANASVIFADNDAHPERVVVRMR